MLSDEERQAIKFLEKLKDLKIILSCSFWNNGEFEFNNIQKEQFDIILGLIEKQSKEIEELKNGQIDFWISDKEIEEIIRNKFVSKEEAEQKEKKAYIDGTNVAHELCNKYWKDKIKAKIEELNKEMLNEENSLELFYRKKYCKEVLQSLLEKE